MNLDHILTLISAGFTKQEILSMQSMIQQPQGVQAQAQQPQVVQVQAQQPFMNPQAQAQQPQGVQPQGVQPQGVQVQPQGVQVQAQPFMNPQTQQNIFGQGYGQGYGQMQGTALDKQMGTQNSGQDANILQAIRNLTSAIQMGNVNQMQNQVPKPTTTEDAIASIINPTWEGLEDKGDKE